MRKKTEYTKIEEVKYTKEQIFCDLCGIESAGYDWYNAAWEINETTIYIKIEQREGENYPEGSYGTKLVIDLCPECFKNKLITWLNSQGANIEEQDLGW
jgi:hypothetical protein